MFYPIIKKANLTFVTKFFLLLVPNHLYPTAADNILTWDRAVLITALVAGLEIDVAQFLISIIHEKDFKFCTTYSFPCMIFQLCRDAEVPIWRRDVLRAPTGKVNIVSSRMRRYHSEGPELMCSF